jgi:MFS family permease
VAPTLGPIVGGWITDTWNWHWLFYVNLVPGIAITLLAPLVVDIDKPDLRLLKDADYPGIALMAISLGTLEYMLEEGTRWNWSTTGLSGPAPGSPASAASSLSPEASLSSGQSSICAP